MTPLQQTALDFCRECLEWEDAFLQEDEHIEAPVSDDGFSPTQRFAFTDLTAVMNTVAEVGLRDSLDFSLRRHGSVKDVPYHAKVWGGGTSGKCRDADPRRALMSACVEANRKLKTAE